MDGPQGIPTAEVESWLEGTRPGGGATTFSTTTLQVNMKAGDQDVMSAPVWVVEHHQDDWDATVGSDPTVIVEICQNGASILRSLNPDRFQMPFGTRVVCIKTAYLENIHIAMQSGEWITPDKVGEKINQVYYEHDPENGEKVLFIFSVNRQRSFCALAEMDGPWVKNDNLDIGLQEGSSFDVVGSIPVTFTHAKNVANEHFRDIKPPSSKQSVTNMWNGMNFEMATGRQVVQVFHQQPHFTNILARDRRKSYTPMNPVTDAKDLDPRMSHKYMMPPSKNYRPRGWISAEAKLSWRAANPPFPDEITPTRANQPRRILPKQEVEKKAPVPFQPRTMKRDNAPAPLNLQGPSKPAQPTQPTEPIRRTQSTKPIQPTQASYSAASLRPGQVFVVDANGNLVAVPAQQQPGAPMPTTPSAVVSGLEKCNETQAHTTPAFSFADIANAIRQAELEKANRQYGVQGTFPNAALQNPHQQQSSMPRVFEQDQRIAPVHPNRYSESSGDASEESNAELSHGSRSTFSEWLAKQQTLQGHGVQQDMPATDWRMGSDFLDWVAKEQGWYADPADMPTHSGSEDSSAFLVRLAGYDHRQMLREAQAEAAQAGRRGGSSFFDQFGGNGLNPNFEGYVAAPQAAEQSDPSSDMRLAEFQRAHGYHHQAVQRYAQKENFRAFEKAHRQEHPSSSNPSSLPSEYKDWASTSEVERQRIGPMSPLSGFSNTFNIGSISKQVSPVTKAFQSSVNRDLRDMSRGQRAGPMPRKVETLSSSSSHEEGETQDAKDDTKSSHAPSDSVDGGVSLAVDTTQSVHPSTATYELSAGTTQPANPSAAPFEPSAKIPRLTPTTMNFPTEPNDPNALPGLGLVPRTTPQSAPGSFTGFPATTRTPTADPRVTASFQHETPQTVVRRQNSRAEAVATGPGLQPGSIFFRPESPDRGT